MTLEELRREIDGIDSQLLPLFLRRMECAAKVAQLKQEQGLPVRNEAREQQILDGVAARAGAYGGEARVLFTGLMAASRAAQHHLLGSGDALRRETEQAPREVPKAKTAACLGEDGSFSHEALLRLCPGAEPLFCADFPAVFSSLENGRADLAVLPAENSLAGSVAEVYDLLLKYRYFILGALSLPVRHCFASRESDINKIQKVYSHPQALRQCAGFLARGKWEILPCASTSEAAGLAEQPGTAAVCSERAARVHGLTVLAGGIQDADDNCTRFLTVGKTLCLPPEAGRVSLCFALPHRTGSLYAVLSQFAAAGLNLTKIESRPIPGERFEYDFYLDFDGNVRDGKTLDLLCALSGELPRFTFLGNYRSQMLRDAATGRFAPGERSLKTESALNRE